MVTPAEPPARSGKAAERALQAHILDERIDSEVLAYVLPDGKPHAWEGSLWDYKLKLPSTSGRGALESKSADALAIAELVKDVVAFHNSYGGLIVAGIDHLKDVEVVGCDNFAPSGFTVEKLNEQVKYYTGQSLVCRFAVFEISPGKRLGVILVPMRKPSVAPVRMKQGAPEKAPGRTAFKKGEVFARVGDSCVPASSDIQVIQFLTSSRSLHLDQRPTAENNLPPRDPGLIRFVGRSEYLLVLWSWLLDRHSPVKIPTALGGTG